MAGHALEEEETTLLGQDGVGGSGHEYYLILFRIFDIAIIPARVTRHVFLDVAPQHILNVLLLETTYNNNKMNPCIMYFNRSLAEKPRVEIMKL